MAKRTGLTAKSIDQTIRANLTRLRKPGVLTVRPGYEITKHQLTGKQAIVATVHTKRGDVPKSDLLPGKIGSIPVDVREATPHQRLRAQDPAAAELTQTYGRPETREPNWPFEREMPSGQLLDSPQSNTQKLLAFRKANQPGTARAAASHAAKNQINYTPPADVVLDPVTVTTTITAHVSPDAGLVTLQNFLQATQQSLVIGMYDFTSGTILRAFETDLSGQKTLQMVLDNPAPNPTRDQTDTQTVDELQQSLGARAQIARALVRSDPFASDWIFPYAYHIKVIVRDGSAFWLSSGNLNNSNQPDLSHPPQTEDRDWHVIIEEAGLAKTFAALLNNDFNVALQHQATGPNGVALARAVADAHAKLAAQANPAPPPPPATARNASSGVAAQVFDSVSVTITPIMTPDKLPGSNQGQYLTNIVKLISGAQQKLYIQLQYIESSSGSGAYNDLLRAIADRVSAGVDVKLIESLQYGEKWAEKMKAAGVDLTANINLQPDVHNKGFVVDSSVVVVSSQNFSPAGIEQNRDAGVIIESTEIAQYFEAVFLSDWTSRSQPFAPAAAGSRGSSKATAPTRRKQPAKAAKRPTKPRARSRAAA